MELNKFSRTLTQEVHNPAAKAMLYGIGLTDEDMQKAQIGIASTGYEGNTCNMHLNGLSVHVKKGTFGNLRRNRRLAAHCIDRNHCTF